jgi:nucleoside-diphosphate-sugar epimerase
VEWKTYDFSHGIMFIVFGATGFIGRAVQAALRVRGTPYFGVGSKTCLRSDGATLSQLDVSGFAECAALLQGLPTPDAVVFAAGTAVTSTKAEILRASHLGSLDAAFHIIPRVWWERMPFVYTSSCTVYQRLSPPRPLVESDPVAFHSAYAEVKLLCESFLAESIAAVGGRSVVARLFNVSGRGQRAGIVHEIAQQAIEIRGGLRSAFHLRTNEPILDVIDVSEAAMGLLALAESSQLPSIVNVCSGRPVTTEDLIAAARRAIGCDVEVGYDVETDRRHMLVGNPDLMIAKTGWRAHRSIDQIVADVISGLPTAEAAA